MSSSDSSKPHSKPLANPSANAQAIPLSGEPKRVADPAQVAPGLYIVSTPIGNLRDITLRAIDTLCAVDEVLAEDTRTARKLFQAHAINTKLTAYHDHNGAAIRPELLERLKAGARIALISDAGTPLVSDPGWKLVREASDAGVAIIPLPGASALLAGLVTSALPSDRFMFCGFLPPKSGARLKALQKLATIPATLVFYEGPSRLAACLGDMQAALGPTREAAIARELTKLFEETRRGTLESLAAHYAETGKPKGEIVILVGPPRETSRPSDAVLEAALRQALQDLPTKAAANQVAAEYELPKRDIYQLALALKNG